MERGKLNIYVECQFRLWETNYQPVIFDKSLCGEPQKFVKYVSTRFWENAPIIFKAKLNLYGNRILKQQNTIFDQSFCG